MTKAIRCDLCKRYADKDSKVYNLTGLEDVLPNIPAGTTVNARVALLSWMDDKIDICVNCRNIALQKIADTIINDPLTQVEA